jgi:hypothetical protein
MFWRIKKLYSCGQTWFLRMPSCLEKWCIYLNYWFLMKMGSIFKKQWKNCSYFGWELGERIFYIITVITAVGVALGYGRHYNTYYVIIAWEWFSFGENSSCLMVWL